MSKKSTQLLRRAATATVGLSLVLTAFLAVPRTTHAVLPVADAFNLIQNTVVAINSASEFTLDYVLNTLSWQLANLAIDSVVKSTVNWINSGFQGSPAFVTDLNRNLQGVQDAVADRFFDELSMQSIAQTPFQDKILDSVRLGYYLSTSPESFYTRYPSTLNQVSPDSRAFLQGDFSQGGFNAWFAATMNPQNNPYGAQILANQALEEAVANATDNRLAELSWNRGFLSWRGECLKSSGKVDLSGKEGCDTYEIRTPGSVIMESLNKTSFAGIDRLVNADQFNEIIGALMNQLVGKVLGTNGLRGVSQPSAGGGASFLDRSTDSSQGGAGSNIGRTFLRSIADQLRRIEDHYDGWQKIQAAAQEAEQQCGPNRGEPNTPAEVKERASVALTRATDAIAWLDSIQTDIMEIERVGGNQSQALTAITNEYTEQSQDILPSAAEIAEAQVESQDTPDQDPGSLYTQMRRLADSRFCIVANDI